MVSCRFVISSLKSFWALDLAVGEVIGIASILGITCAVRIYALFGNWSGYLLLKFVFHCWVLHLPLFFSSDWSLKCDWSSWESGMSVFSNCWSTGAMWTFAGNRCSYSLFLQSEHSKCFVLQIRRRDVLDLFLGHKDLEQCFDINLQSRFLIIDQVHSLNKVETWDDENVQVTW